MYYGDVYYGNNDYRDYIAHYRTPGALNKVHEYLKVIGDGANKRYVYARDKVKDWASKNVTGSYYKKKASGAMEAYRKGRTDSGMMSRAVRDANKGYNKTLAGRAASARTAIKKAATKLANSKAGQLAKSLIERGKNLVLKTTGKARHAVGKATGAYNDKGKSDASSYGREAKPMTKEQLERKRKRAKLASRTNIYGIKRVNPNDARMYFDKDNKKAAGLGGRNFYKRG